MQYTCTNASSRYKDGVAHAQEQRGKVNVPQRVERWQLREEGQRHSHDDDEVVQFQGTIGRKVRIHDLFGHHKKYANDDLSREQKAVFS